MDKELRKTVKKRYKLAYKLKKHGYNYKAYELYKQCYIYYSCFAGDTIADFLKSLKCQKQMAIVTKDDELMEVYRITLNNFLKDILGNKKSITNAIQTLIILSLTS
ncbi:MAG: hypothetical protein Q8936_01330 [Bacillota bacterium]|nr:hypothetical protein [Bacillota bacterium]